MERIAIAIPVIQAFCDGAPAANPNIHGETIEYQFGGRVVSQGSARYFLLGGFAKWWAAPQVIRISDPAGPAPVQDRPRPVAASPVAPPFTQPSQPILELGELVVVGEDDRVALGRERPHLGLQPLDLGGGELLGAGWVKDVELLHLR